MAYITEMGTDADDVFIGTDGNEYSLNGFGGNDTLIGADGNDTLHGGEGDDTLIGGAGDDLFTYAGGDTPVGDTLDGGDGFDNILFLSKTGEHLGLSITDAMRQNIEQITGLDGNEAFFGSALTSGITLNGEAGNDYLEGGQGDDILTGGADADILVGNGGNDFLFGGTGDDRIVYQQGQTNAGDFIDGGEGWDGVSFNSAAGTTLSVSVDDTSFQNIEELVGGQGDDSLDASGLSGGIAMAGYEGNDVLIAGAGSSNLAGG